MPNSNGLIAHRYQLLDRIAAGGVGDVWRAKDLVLDRDVAVKLLRGEYADHPETLARFRAEARHAASLSHPGIAHVYDYGEETSPPTPYLVMEFVNGPSLGDVLAAGPLDAAKAMDVVAQTATGLAAAHAAGLVHRDIKPANLLLAPGGQVKITDFGIAHAAGSAPITRTGTLVGTPAYLAPERAAGRSATAASDLYSLGVVAYQCLAGRAPFTGTPVEVALAHRDGVLPPLPPSVPGEVASLVAHLTEKDPAGRPAGAREVSQRAGQLRDWLSAARQPGQAPGAAGGSGSAWPASAAAMAAGTRSRSSGLPAGPAGRSLGAAGQAPPTITDGAGAAASHGAPPALPATLVAMPATPGEPPRPGGQASDGLPGRRAGRGRGRLLVAAAAVGAVAVAWLVLALTRGSPPRPVSAGTAPSSSPAPSPRRLVDVNAQALIGQPLAVARQQLRLLGLRPRTQWAPPGGGPPRTVVSVRPSGPLPVGSIVTVVAVSAPAGPGHGPGHGHGHGPGPGHGPGQGPGDNGGG